MSQIKEVTSRIRMTTTVTYPALSTEQFKLPDLARRTHYPAVNL